MSDAGVVERRIAGLTVRIDRLLCVGFGDCIEAAPESFELDEEGVVVFRSEADAVERERIVRACAACPVDALTVLDEDGSQLAP
ncbi:MAG TPA: ferredoxin [Gemmatimonadota bacterium]|nr:ferredoxin [Gemmatimonadota bacterium]